MAVVEDKTLYVDATFTAENCGADWGVTKFASIGDAVNAAKEGEKVLIAAGNYDEVISYNSGSKKDITITGETDADGKRLVNWTGGITLGENVGQWKNITVADINFINETGTGSNFKITNSAFWSFENCSFDSEKHDGAFGWNPVAFYKNAGSGNYGNSFTGCFFLGGSISVRANDGNAGYYGLKVSGCTITNTNFNIQSGNSCDIIFENNEITMEYDSETLKNREGKDNAFLVFKQESGAQNVEIRGGSISMVGDKVPENDAGWSFITTTKTITNPIDISGVTIKNATGNSFISSMPDSTNNNADTSVSIDATGNTFVDASGKVVTDAKTIATKILNTKNGTVDIDYSNYKDAKGDEVEESGRSSFDKGTSFIAYTKNGVQTALLNNKKVDMSKIYVDAAYADLAIGTAIEGLNGVYAGVNAFANSKDALTAANAQGGKVTIDVSGMGDASQSSEFALTSAGEYVVTGGNGSIFTPILVNGKDVKLKFDGAFVTLGKLRGGKDKVDKVDVYQKNSIEIVDSVIAQTNYGGYAGGWATFYDCSVTISNSIYGINLSKYDNALELPRSAEDIKAAIEKGEYTLASGHGYDGQHIGTVGFLDIDDSTVFTGFFSVSDRGYADIDNSVIYLCGGMGIGDGTIKNGSDSNESGWGSTSAEDYRVGEVATMDVTDSIVRNLSLNGNGGGLQVGGDNKAGVLNITNSEVDFTVKAANCDKVAIYENGTINMTDSVFKAGSVTNNGTFSVIGESTLLIDNYNGGEMAWDKTVKLLDGAIIKDSNVGGYVDVVGKVTFRGKNTFDTIQDFAPYYLDSLEGKHDGVNKSEVIIEKGASVTLDGKKLGIGYGDKFTINGSLTDAKAAYKADTLSDNDLSLDARKGIYLQGSRAGDNSIFTATDAYIRLSTPEQNFHNDKKSGTANLCGTYKFDWTNSVIKSESTFNMLDSGEYDGKYNFNLTSSVFAVNGQIHYDDKDSTFKAVDSQVVSLFKYDSDAAKTNGTVNNHSNGGTLDFQNSTLEFGSTFINNGEAAVSGEAAALNAPVVVNNGKLSVTNGASVIADTFASALATFNFTNGNSSKALEEITIVRVDSEGNEAGRQTAWLNPSDVTALLTCPDGGSYKFYKGDTEITVSDLEITEADSSEIIIDESGKITAAGFDNNGTITINTSANWSGVATVIDANEGANFGKIVVDDADAAAGIAYYIDEANGDLVVFNKGIATTVYVNADWADSNYAFGQEFESGKYFGINALTELTSATFSGMTDDLVINVYSDIDAEWINTTMNGKKVFGQAITFQKAAGVDGDVTVTLPTIKTAIGGENYAGYFTKDLTIGEGVILDTNGNSMDYGNALRFAPAGDKLTLTVDGTFIYSAGEFGVAKLGEDGLPVMIPTATDGLYDYQKDEATGKIALEEGKSVEVVVNAGGKMLACGESNVTFLANSKLSVTGTGTAEDKMDEVQFSAGSFASFAGEVNFKNTNIEIAGMSSYILGPDAHVPAETFTGDKVFTAENTVINIVDYTGIPNVIAFNKTSNLTNTDISAGNLFVKGKTITMNGGSLTLTSGEADASLGPADDYKSTGKLGISENAVLIAKGSALIDVESVANSGKLIVEKGATFITDSGIANYGSFDVNGNVSLGISAFDGNAINVAGKSVITVVDGLNADLNLKGNITIDGPFSGKVTGNKNITVESGTVNLKADSVVNTITIGGSSKNGVTILQSTVQNLTIKGDFSTVLLNNGGVIKTITIDGSVAHKPLFSGFCLDSFGEAAISGKNNAELTVNSAIFKGNTVKNVALDLTYVNFANGIAIDIDKIGNLKSVNGIDVFGNSTNGYFVTADDVTYGITEADGKVIFTQLSDGANGAVIDDVNGSLDGLTGDIAVEAKAGTAKLTVSKGVDTTVKNITKDEDGGVTNLNLNGNLTVGTTDDHGSVEAVGKITTGSDVEVKVGDVSGTNLNSTISLGKNNEAFFDSIDLKGGNNTLSVGAGTNAEVTYNVKNVKNIKLANGKADAQTSLVIDGSIVAPDMANTITLGNYAKLDVAGDLVNSDVNVGTTIKAGNYSEVIFGEPDGNGNITGGKVTSLAGLSIGTGSTFKAAVVGGTSGNNTISFGNNATAKVKGDINLLVGNDTITLGKDAELEAASISNVQTIKTGVDAEIKITGNIDGVQKLTLGNEAELTAAAVNGTAANDTVKIGNEAFVKVGTLDLGEGKDTLTLGKDAILFVDEILNAETINASKGSMIISENEFSFLNNDDVKGSWDKAQLIQHAALTSGDVAGSVFANEWDVYTFEGVDTLSLDKIENASLKLFEKVGDEWKAVAAYDVFTSDFSGDLDLDVNKKYVLKVSVDDLKAKEEDQYSFKATLA